MVNKLFLFYIYYYLLLKIYSHFLQKLQIHFEINNYTHFQIFNQKIQHLFKLYTYALSLYIELVLLLKNHRQISLPIKI